MLIYVSTPDLLSFSTTKKINHKMDLEDIIDSFKRRINYLSQEWTTLINAASQYGDNRTCSDHMKLLEQKLDYVQEQNAAIIIDLNHIRKTLNLDDSTPNNLFTVLDSAIDTPQNDLNVFSDAQRLIGDQASGKEGSPHSTSCCSSIQRAAAVDRRVERKTEPMVVTPSQLLNQNITDTENQSLKWQDSDSFLGFEEGEALHSYLNCYTQSNDEERKILDSLDSNFKSKRLASSDGLQDIESFDLQMVENPKTVGDLYDEFLTISVPKLYAFQKKFGKGQISKIPKIRTFQRRRALVAEIDKYSAIYNKSIAETISVFDKLRKEKKKSVPWLYNNFNKLQYEFNVRK